jgi:hypothetical protein
MLLQYYSRPGDGNIVSVGFFIFHVVEMQNFITEIKWTFMLYSIILYPMVFKTTTEASNRTSVFIISITTNICVYCIHILKNTCRPTYKYQV